MTVFHLSLHNLASVAVWVLLGAVLGTCHFLGLRLNVGMLTRGGALLLPVAVQFGRFAIMGVALAILARSFGALALLASAAGILIARTISCGRSVVS